MRGRSLGDSQPGGLVAGGAAGVTCGVLGQVPCEVSQMVPRGRVSAAATTSGEMVLPVLTTSSRFSTRPVRTIRTVW